MFIPFEMMVANLHTEEYYPLLLVNIGSNF